MSSTGGPEVSGEASSPVSMEKFKTMAELAGLNMTDQELEELKPLADLHFQYSSQLHAIDLDAEEIAVSFAPDWPD